MKKISFTILLAALLTSSCSTNWEAEDGFYDPGQDNGSEMDTTQTIDKSMYSEARIFPGLVDTLKERRIDTTVVVNMEQPYVSGHDLGLYAPSKLSSSYANFERVPQPIYSTGVYAGAGELITINLPEGNTYGLTAQIGMHSDDLSSETTLLRQPISYYRKTLYPGRNLLRAPLGGYIWILRDKNADKLGIININFRGVYATADYVKGSTNLQQWANKVKTTTVPWLELRSSRMAISISRDQMENLLSQNPKMGEELQRCLDFWDKVAAYRYMQLGLVQGTENLKNRMPDFHERMVFDVQLKGSRLIHTNNEQGTMMLQNSHFSDQLLSWQTIKQMNAFDVYHTFTDKYYMKPKVLDADWDAAENMIPMYRITKEMRDAGMVDTLSNYGFGFNTLLPEMLKYNKVDSVKRIASDISYTSNLKASTHLLMLAQLNEYGKREHQEADWEWYNEVARMYKEGNARQQSYYRLLCDHYKTNFETLMDFYGFGLSDNDRAYGQSYPLLKDEIWMINPGSDTPFAQVGKLTRSWKYRVGRTDWDAIATYADNYGTSNEDTDGKRTVSNLFDNNISTYWGSKLKKDDANLALPYYIIIDMKKATQINGIYFANGWDRCVSGFKVQTLATDGDIHLDDSAHEPWQDWGIVTQTLADSKRNEKFVEFASARRTRYIRLVFENSNLYVRPDETLKPTDAKWFDNNHRNRIQRLAEFGVWHY